METGGRECCVEHRGGGQPARREGVSEVSRHSAIITRRDRGHHRPGRGTRLSTTRGGFEGHGCTGRVRPNGVWPHPETRHSYQLIALKLEATSQLGVLQLFLRLVTSGLTSNWRCEIQPTAAPTRPCRRRIPSN